MLLQLNCLLPTLSPKERWEVLNVKSLGVLSDLGERTHLAEIR